MPEPEVTVDMRWYDYTIYPICVIATFLSIPYLWYRETKKLIRIVTHGLWKSPGGEPTPSIGLTKEDREWIDSHSKAPQTDPVLAKFKTHTKFNSEADPK